MGSSLFYKIILVAIRPLLIRAHFGLKSDRFVAESKCDEIF
jgi:hypothetical protein